MSGFTAPVTGNDEKRRLDNIELIPPGFQLCTLYAMTELGIVEGGNYGPKHKIQLIFEFPQHYRKFYEDSDAKPAAIFCTETFSMNKKANWRNKFIQPMSGVVLTDETAGRYDISQLLGKSFVATIVHSADGKWANIQSISPLNEQNCLMFGLDNPVVEQINKTIFYTLAQGFDTPEFGQLPKGLREKISQSEQGRAFAKDGGKFAEYVKDNSSEVPSENAPLPPSAPSAPSKSGLVMIDKTNTYEQYIKAGWTDEQLIEHGKAKLVENNPVQTPPSPHSDDDGNDVPF